ncbi:MAG: phenylalanine 4-monooxygenase [Ignavibacteria bacterium]|nr:phenylalanine 4-monooxygenase [Ignavibacteria bacterium]MBT8382524.1 phenylalanine 4-monooxygenase [Ignavibacteria bacterium]MBT8390842.1 phenylalanine 4-monooxygenase [Ignavibacteria bacterium]NNJ54204.1 phenylalanine 4-monooxygenase [Ignavibacteriaceae bacterium]NNL21224.1 phenylalanine 4-monooxygenase [Ignavibacteriaceae bacterium]
MIEKKKGNKSENQAVSAYEKASNEEIDPRCIPQKLDAPVPEHDKIVYPDYPKFDQETWKYLYERQMKFLHGRACNEYLDGTKQLNLSSEKIPYLKDMSQIFFKTTGWKVARVPGLIHEQNFFEMLRRKVFPSTDYIRGKDELDYTPAPDLFHDIFGHMPLLTNTNFASFYQKFGEAALNAKGKVRTMLETFHWFTVEFGLIKNPEGMRIYGAGILSSHQEVQHSLSDQVEVIPFDPEKIVTQEYDVWHLQPILFAIDSFQQLEEGFKDWTKKLGLIN